MPIAARLTGYAAEPGTFATEGGDNAGMEFTRPPYVVVDTTEFRADLTLGTRWTATLSAGSYGLLKLAIPVIVRLEAIRHHDQLVSEGERGALKGLNIVRRYAEEPDDIIDAREITQICEATRRGFQYKLEYYIEQAGGRFLPVPAIDHGALVTRAMQGRKPFTSNGKEGYRDALIWYSILDLCGSLDADDHVLFVTGNSRDFCDSGSNALAEPLRQDLAKLAAPPTLTVVPSLRDLHEAYGEAINALATPSNRPPRHPPAPPHPDLLADRIGKICDGLVGSAIPSADIPTPFDQAGLPAIGLDDVLVRDIEEIDEPGPGAPITPIVDDMLTREMAQSASVALEGVMTESDFARYVPNDIDELQVLEAAATPGQLRVRLTRPALLFFQVTYDVRSGSIDRIHLALVEYVVDVLAEHPFFDLPDAADDGVSD
ncbi:PIN domain-containing protein [Amycolatopsis sp. WGS_07]|uniref:PIN domain-containing protein n=1 Tax=Amycolatopsis sp. WGS_07 TaxID=3076764 RepID=UPI0038730CD4